MGYILILALGTTIIEVWGLVRWFGLALAATYAVAFGFLFAVILVEEGVRFRSIRGRFPTGTELTLLVVGVLIETIGWALAFAYRTNPALAFLLLLATLDLEHAIIRTATSTMRLLANPLADIWDGLWRVSDFTAVEAVGGTIWLVAPNVGTFTVMAITSVLEHVQGIRQAFGFR